MNKANKYVQCCWSKKDWVIAINKIQKQLFDLLSSEFDTQHKAAFVSLKNASYESKCGLKVSKIPTTNHNRLLSDLEKGHFWRLL